MDPYFYSFSGPKYTLGMGLLILHFCCHLFTTLSNRKGKKKQFKKLPQIFSDLSDLNLEKE